MIHPSNTVYKNKETVCALAIFTVTANLFIAYFIRQEHFLYYWDHINFWSKSYYLCHHFIGDTFAALKTLIYSIREDDYNYLPAFILMPFGLLFGTSRLAYILSIVNMIALPVAVSFVMLHKKFCQAYGLSSAALPFISASIALLLPNFWNPILYGMPDIGGMFLINIILLLYISRPFSEQSLLRLVIIAILISTIILFRRWYAYWGVSFYIALSIVECGALLVNRPFETKNVLKILSKIFMQGFISAVFLFTVAPTFVRRIIRTNYADLYSVYRENNTLLKAFQELVSNFGLFYFFLFVLGAIVSVMNKKTRRFSILLLIQAPILFVLFAKTQDFHPHHLYLLMPTMLLFPSLFITRLLLRARRFTLILACGLVFIFMLSIFSAFSPEGVWNAGVYQKVLTHVRHVPLVRSDIDDIKEVDRMLSVLEELVTSPDDRIYVLASSPILNCSILDSAYLTLNRHQNVAKKILWTNDVDKRDGFPREFLTAQYVVVADPIQYHLIPKDQRVVGIPAELVLKETGIGSAFSKLPYEFNLDGNVKAYIYKKIKPFSDSDLEMFSELLKKDYPDRPNIYEMKKGS